MAIKDLNEEQAGRIKALVEQLRPRNTKVAARIQFGEVSLEELRAFERERSFAVEPILTPEQLKRFRAALEALPEYPFFIRGEKATPSRTP